MPGNGERLRDGLDSPRRRASRDRRSQRRVTASIAGSKRPPGAAATRRTRRAGARACSRPSIACRTGPPSRRSTTAMRGSVTSEHRHSITWRAGSLRSARRSRAARAPQSAISFCSSSPDAGWNSCPDFSISARNSGSLTMASKAARSTFTRSAGNARRREHRAADRGAAGIEGQDLASLRRVRELHIGRHVGQVGMPLEPHIAPGR